MPNFTCKLDCATGCPDIQLHIILVCLWWCFWMRLTFESADWVKQTALPNTVKRYPLNRRSLRFSYMGFIRFLDPKVMVFTEFGTLSRSAGQGCCCSCCCLLHLLPATPMAHLLVRQMLSQRPRRPFSMFCPSWIISLGLATDLLHFSLQPSQTSSWAFNECFISVTVLCNSRSPTDSFLIISVFLWFCIQVTVTILSLHASDMVSLSSLKSLSAKPTILATHNLSCFFSPKYGYTQFLCMYHNISLNTGNFR